ncbi:MAG: hypothetical protein HKN04_03655, partial [Rhodothermaceae bacterium]|nr:hypothetical protein [Rhodothermaceae bacterium]
MTLQRCVSLLVLSGLITVPVFGQIVTTITDEFGGSGDVAIGPDGNAYVADFGVTLSNANGTTVYR